jgi:multiple sugar transport system permease protein
MIIVLPYMINGIAIGYIFKMFYTHGYVLDSILCALGANIDILPYWLRNQDINNWALAFSSVWRYSGLSLVVFLGAIGSIEHSLFEASSLDGASRMQQIKYIIWPSIRRVVSLTFLLSIVTSLSEFELPYSIASGGANGTATYMTLIYHIAFTERKIGLASAMAVVLLIQLILFTSILFSIANTFKDE